MDKYFKINIILFYDLQMYRCITILINQTIYSPPTGFLDFTQNKKAIQTTGLL